ncbi:MAG: hypothetical protein NC102_02890 [Clostridium sp.]|nr:hypothetical protein [Clostridium sp.]
MSVAAAALALAACSRQDKLQPGDLLFQACESSDFVDAINGATSGSTRFSHVGIFCIEDGLPMVIEATPSRGVVATPLDSFLAEPVVAMRLSPGVADADKAIERARLMIGMPYDWEFDPANAKMYCSELVQAAYLDPFGRPVFESIPMNFMAADTMPRFWIDLFHGLGKPIPQGAPGTNPNSIAASPALRIIEFSN